MTTEATTETQLVTITDAAVEKAKALLEARDLPEGALRVFVAGGGCSGYQYGMALARSTEEDDLVLEQGGVRIVVDEVMKSGCSIYTPTATKSCACGASFPPEGGGGEARPCGH